MDAAEVNETPAWLADLTARTALPRELLVVHQFRLSMIRDEPSLVIGHDELARADPHGRAGATRQKATTWKSVVAARPDDRVPMDGRIPTTKTIQCSPRSRRCATSRPR